MASLDYINITAQQTFVEFEIILSYYTSRTCKKDPIYRKQDFKEMVGALFKHWCGYINKS